ncbi:MAG: hypothetical protein DMG53_28290 [Acidobacteria bacterium]|nr:MAG: hypothetical protein DMG53_28290 [Acidobacteriota bacterium]
MKSCAGPKLEAGFHLNGSQHGDPSAMLIRWPLDDQREKERMATPYKINIPMYAGPLDLLLDLIKQQKMNIDPRAELVQRLVEHEKFKNAAQLLYQKQQIEENVWSKPDKSLYHDEGTAGELVVSLVDLVRVFQQVLERQKEVSRIELRHEEFTVAQMIAALRTQILASADNSVNLIQFFEACPSRHAMIVAFLAVLEMVKLQAVELVQEKQFGDILVRKHKMFDLVFDEAGGIKLIDEEYK